MVPAVWYGTGTRYEYDTRKLHGWWDNPLDNNTVVIAAVFVVMVHHRRRRRRVGSGRNGESCHFIHAKNHSAEFHDYPKILRYGFWRE
jgi:hypothetical protein